jgi:hypothetical protein
MMGKFYLAVVQSVLTVRTETWVLSRGWKNALEGFHTIDAQRTMTGSSYNQTQRMKENGLHHRSPPLAAGLLLMTYVKTEGRDPTICRDRAIYRKCRRSTPMAGNVNQHLVAVPA